MHTYRPCIVRTYVYIVYIPAKHKMSLYLDPAKWMGVGVPLSKPLGFKHHPLEGAGMKSSPVRLHFREC